mmetsp:Transcript_12982/g.41485  ORF Transcript_12982/g.41485 Transcript_12982/m.41485 type:complete len:352 (-) Transcript_12982:265-1320(-)
MKHVMQGLGDADAALDGAREANLGSQTHATLHSDVQPSWEHPTTGTSDWPCHQSSWTPNPRMHTGKLRSESSEADAQRTREVECKRGIHKRARHVKIKADRMVRVEVEQNASPDGDAILDGQVSLCADAHREVFDAADEGTVHAERTCAAPAHRLPFPVQGQRVGAHQSRRTHIMAKHVLESCAHDGKRRRHALLGGGARIVCGLKQRLQEIVQKLLHGGGAQRQQLCDQAVATHVVHQGGHTTQCVTHGHVPVKQRVQCLDGSLAAKQPDFERVGDGGEQVFQLRHVVQHATQRHVERYSWEATGKLHVNVHAGAIEGDGGILFQLRGQRSEEERWVRHCTKDVTQQRHF